MARANGGRRTLVLVCLAVGQLLLTEAALPIVTGLATLKLPPWLGWLKPGSSRPWWALGLLLFIALMAAALQSRQRRSEGSDPPPPATEPVDDWVVRRPSEARQVADILLRRPRRRDSPAGITAVVYGSGGFGKTTLIRLVCTDRRVQRYFKGRIYCVTIGRDVQSTDSLAAKVNATVELITGNRPSFTSSREAGQNLSRVMDSRPRSLLVLDDVWTEAQLAPFRLGGRRWARLVTSRVPASRLGESHGVEVGRMTAEQARAVLTGGLAGLSRTAVDPLLEATGQWPLLLRLLNRILHNQADIGADVTAKCAEVLGLLQAGGPASVDRWSGHGDGLGLDETDSRHRTVRSTIEASTGLLDPDEAARLNELGVFAEDESIPARLVVRLWQATSGTAASQWEGLCGRLAGLGLITLKDATVSSHDIVHDYLRQQIGEAGLIKLNGLLLDAVAADLPPAEPLVAGLSPASVSWWELPTGERYLWDNIVHHLIWAGRRDEAEALACDLRWVIARLTHSGLSAPVADLALIGTRRAASVMHSLTRMGHLLDLADTEDVLASSVLGTLQQNSEVGDQAAALSAARTGLQFTSRWPLPDVSDPALRRVLECGPAKRSRRADVKAIAVAPDGSWLASGGGAYPYGDYSVQVWDPATGTCRAVLRGRSQLVRALAVAPDGSWLASAGGLTRFGDRSVWVWDMETGACRAVLGWHYGAVRAIAGLVTAGRLFRAILRSGFEDLHALRVLVPGPDGAWLASAGTDQKVRVWNPVTGSCHAVLKGHTGLVNTVAAAPDGSWLASASDDRTVRVWEPVTGKCRAVLKGHTGKVKALAVAPDGSWLASASDDTTIRVWDPATWACRVILEGHTRKVNAVAAAPDGTWLASGGHDATVRVWDPLTGDCRATVDVGAGSVALAVAPDGSWLACASEFDRAVRVWDPAGWTSRAVLSGHRGTVSALVAAPDGSWLASASADQTVRIWDPAPLADQRAIAGGASSVNALAVAPDGSWLASAESFGGPVLWDPATGESRAVLTGYQGGTTALAVAPDGSWLATAAEKDKSVWIWDPLTAESRAVLEGHTVTVGALAVAPDGSWLASASDDRTVRVWEPVTGECRAVLEGHTGKVKALAVAPDGSWLASASDDTTIRVWDPATWTLRATLTGHSHAVRVLAVAPDGSWLASASGRVLPGMYSVRLWDPVTGSSLAVLNGHLLPVLALAAAPDGSWLASGSSDGSIRVWDPAGGRAGPAEPSGLRALYRATSLESSQRDGAELGSGCRAVLRGHSDAVKALAVAPDGSWLASAGLDETVRVWDPSSGQEMTAFKTGNSLECCLSLPDGHGIAVGGDSFVQLFDVRRAVR